MFTARDGMEGASPVEASTQLDLVALARWLGDRTPIAPPLTASRFNGGQSNPTFLIEDAARRRLVVRRAALAAPQQAAREHRVLEGLYRAGFPAPPPIALCEDTAPLGAPFQVSGFVPGRTFWDQALPECLPSQRQTIYARMIEALADLHRLDPAAMGLAGLGRADGYVQRQIARWNAQLRGAEDVEAAVGQVADWALAWTPPPAPGALLHGDYRLDNLIFHPDIDEVAGVVDWETATLGDPFADLAFHLFAYSLPGDLLNGLDRPDLSQLGIPSAEAQLAAYLGITGLAPPHDWVGYEVYALFRLMCVLRGIERRVRDGVASNPRAGLLIGSAARVAEIAVHRIAARG